MYLIPNFDSEEFKSAPEASFVVAQENGVAPDGFYSTTNLPTFIKVNDKWTLPKFHRMDCVVVKKGDDLETKEFRKIVAGEEILTGEDGIKEEGVYILSEEDKSESGDVFKFFSSGNVSPEKPILYEEIASALKQHKEKGFIIWVLGPAVLHSRGRKDVCWLIENGFVHAVFAGNALPVHDLEMALMGTTLGMNAQGNAEDGGHRHHVDAINIVRGHGTVEEAIKKENIKDGIMYHLIKNKIPSVFAGSIRDDGPMPGVITDSVLAQDEMRKYTSKATASIMIATTLHSIATGNMLPTYYIEDNKIKPLINICVDRDEFVVNKLMDRGSHQAHGVVTNCQDFLRSIVQELK